MFVIAGVARVMQRSPKNPCRQRQLFDQSLTDSGTHACDRRSGVPLNPGTHAALLQVSDSADAGEMLQRQCSTRVRLNHQRRGVRVANGEVPEQP